MQAQLDDINDETTVKTFHQFKESIIDCAKNIRSNDATFEISTLPKISDKLANHMTNYIDTVHKLESYQKAFLQINDELDKMEEEHEEEPEDYVDLDEYRKLFDSIVQQEMITRPNEIGAKKVLEKILKPPEEDIQMEAPTRQIPRDPMTKKPIRIAVRSTVCGHIYDKDGIEEYFRLKILNNRANRIQCPQAGCTNKRMSKDELVLDEETNNLIQSLL